MNRLPRFSWLTPATPIGFGTAFFIAKLLRKNIYNREKWKP